MLKMKFTVYILLACNFVACGQLFKNHSHQNLTEMDTNKITNTIAKSAIEAWQDGNSKLWLSFFTDDAELFDDGNIRNFKKFTTEAIGHEHFTSIDKIEDNGTSVYGEFHSDTWGDFKTYFKFHINQDGKIYQLEIGQADY